MSFRVHDGSFGSGTGNFSGGLFHLPKRSGWGYETVKAANLASAEIASEQNIKKLGGTLGWGAAGGLVLGPAGLLAGLLLDGKKTEVSFIITFQDGRAFIATADHRTWVAIKGSSLVPIAANQAATARAASLAQCREPQQQARPEPSLTSAPADFLIWAFEEGGWEYRKAPRSGSERFTIYQGDRGKRSILIALTPDPITFYSLEQMSDAFARLEEETAERIVVGKAPARDVERIAEGMGVRFAALSDIKLLIARK